MSELTAEERAEVIRAIKEQHPGAGPGADVELKIYSQKANTLQNLQRVLICPSPKLDASAFSITSLVFLPTKIFEIKIRS
jgi:hypothetical protein